MCNEEPLLLREEECDTEPEVDEAVLRLDEDVDLQYIYEIIVDWNYTLKIEKYKQKCASSSGNWCW